MPDRGGRAPRDGDVSYPCWVVRDVAVGWCSDWVAGWVLAVGSGQGILVPWSEPVGVPASDVGLVLRSGSVVAQRLAWLAAGSDSEWGSARRTGFRSGPVSGLPMVLDLSLRLLSWWVRGMG